MESAWLPGSKGSPFFCFALPLSFAVFTTGALFFPLVRLSWNIGSLVLYTGIATSIVGVTKRLLRERWKDDYHKPWSRVNFATPLVATLAAFIYTTINLLKAFKTPDALAQRYDSVFHYNAIRYVLDASNASPFYVGSLTGEKFYPAGWYDIVTTINLAGNTSIALAANVATLLFIGLAFTSGIIFLTRTLFGNRPPFTIAAAFLSAGTTSFFPYTALSWGNIFPYVAGLCLLPFVIALAVIVFDYRKTYDLSKPTAALLLTAVLGSAALIHTSIIATAFLLTAPIAAWSYRHEIRSCRRYTVLYAAIPHALLIIALFVFLRPSSVLPYRSIEMSAAQAIGEVFTLSPHHAYPNAIIAIFFLAGAFLLFKDRQKAVLVCSPWAVSSLLYILNVSLPDGTPRTIISGYLYNDSNRIASLVVITGIPIAAYGCCRILHYCVGLFYANRHSIRKYAALALVLSLAIQIPVLGSVKDERRDLYKNYNDENILSKQELALIERIPRDVPDDATIVNDPYDGSGLIYALSGRNVMLPHMLVTKGFLTDDKRMILDHAKDYASQKNFCASMERLHSYYFTYFGTHGLDGRKLPGPRRFEDDPNYRLIDDEGEDARLYRFTGCDR